MAYRIQKATSWSHRSFHGNPVPTKHVKALAVMTCGITDYETIARVCDIRAYDWPPFEGITENAVDVALSYMGDTWTRNLVYHIIEDIDMSDHPSMRQMMVKGIPPGEYFNIHGSINCSRCKGRLITVPCVQCAMTKEQADDNRNASETASPLHVR